MNRPRRSTHSFSKYLFPRARNPINSCQRERKKKKESSRDVVSSSQFLELIDSSSNTESSSRLSQTRVNRVNFKITKFPRQTLSQHFPLPQFTQSPFFPSEATDSNRSTFPSLLSLTLSYHCLVSSRDRIVANFLPTPPTSHLPDWESIVLPERFPSPVHFRFISINRSFSQNLRLPREVSFPREGSRGGKERALGTHRQTIDPFSLPVAFHPVVTRSLTGSVILYGEIRVHSNFSGL